MQEVNNVNQLEEEFEDGDDNVAMYIDDFIEMLQTKKKELGVDAIEFYIDEEGGVEIAFFDSTKVNMGEA